MWWQRACTEADPYVAPAGMLGPHRDAVDICFVVSDTVVRKQMNRVFLEGAATDTDEVKAMRTHKKAFTLIELLVVVSIIAVLVSILLPSLARAKEAAGRALCQANLRQMFTLTSIYAADNDGAWVEGFTSRDGGLWFVADGLGVLGYKISWMDLIGGTDAPALFDCPTIKRTMPNSNELNMMPTDYPYDYPLEKNYAYSTYLAKDLAGCSRPRMEQMRSAAHIVCFMDGRRAEDQQAYAYAASWEVNWDIATANEKEKRLAWPHNGKSNVAFCDGHVAREDPLALSDVLRFYWPDM